MKRLSALSLLLLALAPILFAQSPAAIPEPVVPQPFGVNIHFVRPNEAEVDALASTGYRVVRMDFAWSAIEKKKGEYDFSGYDALVESMSRRGIRLLFILDYGNKLYDDGLSPHSDESRAAFAKWAAAAAKRYAGKPILWEIWNEPNIGFWKPTPNAEDYCKLALAAIEAIRGADPGAFIIAPASSGFPWAFFDVMAERGVFARLDAVSVHPYRQSAPETAEGDYHRLRLLLQHAGPDKHLPILSGEWGYSTGWKNLSEQTQAQYLVRQWLFNMAGDIGLSIWYDWKDDGADPKEPEHHFGSVYRDLKPKAASRAAQALANTLRGYRFLRRIAADSPDDYLLLLRKDEQLAIAAWTTAQPHAISIPAAASFCKLIDMTGTEAALKAERLMPVIELTSSPTYLLLSPGAINSAFGCWRPERSVHVIRAGEDAAISLHIDYNSRDFERAYVYLGQGKDRRTTIDLKAERSQTVSIPVRINDRTRAVVSEQIHFSVPMAYNWMYTARITLLVSNAVSVSVLPPVADGLVVLISNPSGQPLKGVMRAVRGTASSTAPLDLPIGQKEATAFVPFPAPAGGEPCHVEAADQAGNLLFRSEPASWQAVAVASGQTWKAWTEGDQKVAASVGAAVVARPDPAPQPGLATALEVSYRFAAGWRYALVAPPEAMIPIVGKPRDIGMWVLGDGSGDILRCRFKDSSGQVFQPSFGPITWTGWKWITMPIDGRDAHHWAGANDGVVRYPIQWDAILLIDSARAKVDQDLRFLAAGVGLRY